MIDGLMLVLGFVVLIKAADFLVQGASLVATRLGLSPLVIGLTVVSFGTSMPEMLVTLTSGLHNNADLAISNVIGSNIANVLLVLGVAAIIRPLPVHNSTLVSEIPFSLTAALLVGFLANAALFSEYSELSINQLDGGILLLFFFLFLLYLYKISRSSLTGTPTVAASGNIVWAIVLIVLGTVGLYVGGQWVVNSAVSLADTLGLDHAVIGLTVIAFGTSAPELMASAMAAYRGQTNIAVGNVIGSNIFNLLWVLGLTSSIVELPFEVINNTDLVMVIVSSTLIIFALVFSRNNTLYRGHGVFFVSLYIAYLWYVAQRIVI